MQLTLTYLHTGALPSHENQANKRAEQTKTTVSKMTWMNVTNLVLNKINQTFIFHLHKL